MLRVLFVSSGNKKEGISPIVSNQGESIRARGVELSYFTIHGKGLKGYIAHWYPLLREIRLRNYDVIHAHYSLCGILATLAAPQRTPLIVSLMGTFHRNSWKYHVVRSLAKYRWKEVIVKSERMKEQIGIERAHVIPNGVDIDKFKVASTRCQLRKELGLSGKHKVVIFVSDPSRPEKNFALCERSVKQLDREDVQLVAVYNRPHEEVVKYMLAADVLMLTSLSEGSPNVIKEAMAANCPIVSTDVGDVAYLLDNLPGTYVAISNNVQELAELLKKALDFGARTEGLRKLYMLGLSDKDIADKIIELYSS